MWSASDAIILTAMSKDVKSKEQYVYVYSVSRSDSRMSHDVVLDDDSNATVTASLTQQTRSEF